MARRGVWQLQKLTVNYCEHSGSSRGAREFVEHLLPLFSTHNPQVAVEPQRRPGRHPNLRAEYVAGSTRVVDIKNTAPDDILRRAILLRSCAGRKASKRVYPRQVTSQPSIQQPWKAQLDLAGQLQYVNRQ